MQKALYPLLQVSFIFVYLCAINDISLAQVTPDNTVNTQVNQNGNVAEITGGETRDSNLFHSFQDFSVPANNEAFFDNSNSISNIFSRVTGGNISNIDGLIRANGNANLFLINPAGIIFGEGARLDIGGSFYGSTATSILFEDGEFSAADLDNPPLLTVNAPIGLGFRDNPGEITNRSVADNLGLQVLSGQNISLLGGNINLTGGKITAPGGVINLGGLSTEGTINIEQDANFSFPNNVAKANIFLTDNAVVDITSEVGGLITVNANDLELTGESLFLANIGEGLGSENAVAGTIQINSTSIFADNNSLIHSDNLGIGQAGTINIATGSLNLTNGSAITATTFGVGDAGTINITAQDIALDQEFTGIYSNVGLTPIASDQQDGEGVVGNAGIINIDTDTLSLTNGARIVTTSIAQGNGGEINISATGEVSFIGQGVTPVPTAFNNEPVNSGTFSLVEQDGVGNSGEVNIEAGSLALIDRGAVVVNNNGVGGDAGDITLDIQNNIFLDQTGLILAQIEEGSMGNGGDINITSVSLAAQGSSFILADTKGTGNAGNINIDVEGTLSLDDGTRILTEVQDNAIGNAGDINITANSLILKNNASIASQTLGQGDAGDIIVNARESISLDNESAIQSSVDNPDARENNSDSEILNNDAVGDAGDITITTGELTLNNDSVLDNTSFARGNAGNITVNARGRVFLDGSSQFNSDVNDLSAGEFDAVGNAGTIDITAQEVIFQDNSTLQSSTSGQGNAGNVIINSTGNVTFDGNFSGIISQVRGEGVGDGGNIQITAGESLTVRDQSIILANASEEGKGNAGSVSLNAGKTFSLSESLVLSQIEGEAEGNAGGININANTIDINNFSLVSTNAQIESSGAAGNIDLNAANISINSGSVVDALTENGFDGGNIRISGGNLEIVSGGVVVTSADNAGNAGSINLDLTGNITINGEGTIPRPEDVFALSEQALVDLQESTGLFANSSAASTGNGGNIEVINTGDLGISNKGNISVDSQGAGNGGILTINTESLNLDNQAAISAITASGNGGNINLTVDDTIRLENNSIISTQASDNGNGGNINIDTNFIVAFPNQNNDIVANAQQGRGGNIEITAESVFGIVERNSNPPNNTNDIDASSEFGLNGTVSIFTPDTSNLQTITELPSNIVEPQQTTTQACNAARELADQTSLILKGKGGIASSPDSPLNSTNIRINGENVNSSYTIPKAITLPRSLGIATSQGHIQPARGIIKNEDGEVILTAYRTSNSGDKPNGIAPQRIPHKSINCNQAG